MELPAISIPLFKGWDIFGFFLTTSLFFLLICFIRLTVNRINLSYGKACLLYFISVFFILLGGRLFTLTSTEWQEFGTMARCQEEEESRYWVLCCLVH